MIKKVLLMSLLLFSTQAYAYESEDKVQAVIIGKLAKFISWNSAHEEYFVITVLHDPFDALLDRLYLSKMIKKKQVKIRYIENIENIEDMVDTNILYIPQLKQSVIDGAIAKTKGKNILTISDSRGFAEKGGMIQLYFADQKIKIKINNALAKAEGLKIKSSLLRISTIVTNEIE